MSRPAFPLATWRPSRDEYFEALAPAGGSFGGEHPGWGMLHGSSAMKLAERSLRAYGEVLAAKLTGLQGLLLSPRARAVLKSQESTAAMRFGSAVESLVMPGDPMPADVFEDEEEKERAKVRAGQILEHPDAGKYLRAKGAAYQVAHRWQDEESGLWFRLRYDLCYWGNRPTPQSPAVQDLKIWSRIGDERQLRWKIRDMGADLQAALYRRGALDLWGVAPPHTLVIAGPNVLDPIFVRTLSDQTIADADDRISATAHRLAECYRTGEFIDEAERPQEI